MYCYLEGLAKDFRSLKSAGSLRRKRRSIKHKRLSSIRICKDGTTHMPVFSFQQSRSEHYQTAACAKVSVIEQGPADTLAVFKQQKLPVLRSVTPD